MYFAQIHISSDGLYTFFYFRLKEISNEPLWNETPEKVLLKKMQIQLSKKECEANIALKNWREDNEALKLAFKASKAQEGSENAYKRYAR